MPELWNRFKQIEPLRLAFGLGVVSTLFCVVAFVSPYWLEARPRAHSTFVRIGLWEACFNDFIHYSDDKNKNYYGCWWVFSSTYFHIRRWLLPGWYIFCMASATLSFIAMLLGMCTLLMLWLRQHKPRIALVKGAMISWFLAGFLELLLVIVFGAASKAWWDWMPHAIWNFLSWSYGFAVISSFFSFFTVAALYRYFKFVQKHSEKQPYEIKKPPPPEKPKHRYLPSGPPAYHQIPAQTPGSMGPPYGTGTYQSGRLPPPSTQTHQSGYQTPSQAPYNPPQGYQSPQMQPVYPSSQPVSYQTPQLGMPPENYQSQQQPEFQPYGAEV